MVFYFEKMEDTRKIFAVGSRKIAEIKGWTQVDIAAKISGGKQGTVSSWLRGRTKFPVNRMQEFATMFEMSISDILEIGRRELQSVQASQITLDPEQEEKLLSRLEKKIRLSSDTTHTPEYYASKKNTEHHKTVDQFLDQEKALSINKMLVRIEALDPASLEEIKGMMQVKLDALEKRYGGKQTDTGTGGTGE